MQPTSIVVDLRNTRCGDCKVALHDDLATVCPVCGAPFDSVLSNHVGVAERLMRRRDAAGVTSADLKVHGTEYEREELVSS
jgi:predicted amidophosphoribosyltransferase